MSNYLKKLKKVKAFLFDVDGVFSKEFIVMENGRLYRIMNAKDGFAVREALKNGFPVGIISGAKEISIQQRFELLGVNDIYLNHRDDKLQMAELFCNKYNLQLSDILYMGDDLPDYQLMQKVGFSAAPADAVEEIKAIANYISDKKGGEGCVREIIEKVLKIQGKWITPLT